MAKWLIKNIIFILSIPLLIAVTKSFYFELTGIATLTEMAKYFFFGVVAYVGIYIVFLKMDYLYILGHEVVHALCVWLFGGRVRSFKVTKEGGSISATKSNLFIDLIPYLIPIYTILVAVAYFLAVSFWKIDHLLKYFVFFMGFSFSFHIVLTIDKLKIEQPDFFRFGYTNSVAFIFLINIIVMSLFLGFIIPDFSFRGFIANFFITTKDLYVNIFNQLFRV